MYNTAVVTIFDQIVDSDDYIVNVHLFQNTHFTQIIFTVLNPHYYVYEYLNSLLQDFSIKSPHFLSYGTLSTRKYCFMTK